MDQVSKTDSSAAPISDGSASSSESQSSSNRFEYEAQHFGFTPITLLNGMFNAVCDLYREALKAFCKTCKEKYPSAMTEEELTKARRSVSELIDQDVCKMFDTLEYYLLNQVLSIPENAILPEDRCQLERLDKEGESDLERRRNDAKRRIIALKYANAQLSQHLKDAAVLQATLDQVVEKMSSSEGNVSQLNGKTLKDWMSYYSDMLRNGMKDAEQSSFSNSYISS